MKFLILFFFLLTFSTNTNDLTFDTELFFLEDNNVHVDEGWSKTYYALFYEPISNRYFISDRTNINLSDTNTNLHLVNTNFYYEYFTEHLLFQISLYQTLY